MDVPEKLLNEVATSRNLTGTAAGSSRSCIKPTATSRDNLPAKLAPGEMPGMSSTNTFVPMRATTSFGRVTMRSMRTQRRTTSSGLICLVVELASKSTSART